MIVPRTATAGALLVFALTGAAAARDGFYVRAELGANASPGVTMAVGDNDRAARCDGFVNPLYASLPGCTSPDRSINAVDQWSSSFDGATGALAGAALGYRFSPRLRLELEYLFRQAVFDESSNIIAPSGSAYIDIFDGELTRAQERLGSATAHHAFVNVLFDFPVGRATPYVGAGAGIADASLDYGSHWARSLDPETIDSAAGLPNERHVRDSLAGTVTLAQATLRDRLSGVQVLAGVAFDLNDALALDVKVRWAEFSELRDGGSYVLLRSHESNLRTDGSEPVRYSAGADDTGFVAATVGLVVDF